MLETGEIADAFDSYMEHVVEGVDFSIVLSKHKSEAADMHRHVEEVAVDVLEVLKKSSDLFS